MLLHVTTRPKWELINYEYYHKTNSLTNVASGLAQLSLSLNTSKLFWLCVRLKPLPKSKKSEVIPNHLTPRTWTV